MLSERMKNFLENLKEGDIVKFKVKDFGKDTLAGVTDELEDLKGKLDIVTKIYDYGFKAFKTRLSGDSYADFSMITIPTKAEIEQYMKDHEDEGVEKRDYLDFKVGDLVKIRDFEDMVRQYGVQSNGDIYPPSRCCFTRSMKSYCGLKYVISSKSNEYVKLSPFDSKKSISQYYNVTMEMIEIVEAGYKDRIQKEMEEQMKQVTTEIPENIEEEMIAKVDKNKFSKILAGSFGIRTIDLKGVDKLLEQWAKAKKEMYLLFGNRLKISKQIETKITEDDARAMLNDIIAKYPATFPIMKSIYPSEIINNSMEHNPLNENWSNAPIVSYKKGMKASKYISEVFKNKDLDVEFSKIVAVGKSVGIIDISIDPVDYATMSMNKSGWQSCHSLHKDYDSRLAFGEWSGGTISYMVDEATIIAFRHSDTIFDYEYNGIKFKEYSKNWRELLYYDKVTHSFTANRQYPSDNEEVAKEVRNLFEETIATYLDVENKWKSIKNFKNRDSIVTDVTDLHYNDVLKNTSALCRLVRLQTVDKSTINIRVGGAPVCSVCGERPLTDHHYPVCETCLRKTIKKSSEW